MQKDVLTELIEARDRYRAAKAAVRLAVDAALKADTSGRAKAEYWRLRDGVTAAGIDLPV